MAWLTTFYYYARLAINASTKFLQVELDMVYEGKDFNIPMKLAQHLAYTSCVLVYSCAIPDSIVALPFYFVTHYWLDKWMILRVGKVPPRFSILLNDRANSIFGFIVILHILSSMWFFSVPEIFP